MKCEELNGRYFNHNIGVSVKFLGFSVAASAGDVWVSFPSFQYPLLWGEREREREKISSSFETYTQFYSTMI